MRGAGGLERRACSMAVHGLLEEQPQIERWRPISRPPLLLLKEAPSATLKAFSTSQIGGAYGDAGQNYKNIAVLLKALPNMPFTELQAEGCSATTAAVETSSR